MKKSPFPGALFHVVSAAGLEGGPSNGTTVEVDQLELAGVLVEGTGFFGAVEVLVDETGH